MCSFTLSMFCHLGSFFAIFKSLNGLYTLELAMLPMPWLCGGIKICLYTCCFVGCILLGLGYIKKLVFYYILYFFWGGGGEVSWLLG